MHKASVMALVIAALLFGCGVGMIAVDFFESPAVAQTQSTGMKWKHVCTKLTKEDFKGGTVSEDLGLAGYEMVGVTGFQWSESTHVIACFKRPTQ